MSASNAVLAGSFTLAYWCVLVAALLPYACASLAKSAGVGKSRRDGGFDNHDPRAWLAQQKGRHARAAVSVPALPRGVAVEVDAIFEIV